MNPGNHYRSTTTLPSYKQAATPTNTEMYGPWERRHTGISPLPDLGRWGAALLPALTLAQRAINWLIYKTQNSIRDCSRLTLHLAGTQTTAGTIPSPVLTITEGQLNLAKH